MLQPGTVLVSLPLENLRNPKPLHWFSASAQFNLAAPLPRKNLFGAGSTLFRASNGADSSAPAPTEVHMDL